jgi:hypothetical protein
LQWIKPGSTCAEIGVWEGHFSHQILDRDVSRLHLIDPWEIQPQYERRPYGTAFPAEEIDGIYESVKNVFTDDPRVIIHREYSGNMVFQEEYFDWVYIDGNHSYENVLLDLETYWPFVKVGGILCGDDYGWEDKHTNGGVYKAVNEFANKRGIPFLDAALNQFMFFKGIQNESIHKLAEYHHALCLQNGMK